METTIEATHVTQLPWNGHRFEMVHVNTALCFFLSHAMSVDHEVRL